MDSSSDVLYQNLLEDLSPHLPTIDIKKSVQVDPWPDITPAQFACLALAKSFYKKFVDFIDAKADERALQKFLHINDMCGNWELKVESTWDEILIGEVKNQIYKFLNPGGMPLVSSFDEILKVSRNGPGASIGSVGGDSYTKLYSSNLSHTRPVLYRAFRNYIKWFAEDTIAENIRKENYGDPLIVAGNRLRFVPKQRDISRVICVEPVLNMYMQLGMASILEDRLKSFYKIDLSFQPELNRELARIGSLDGSLFTIDLSSASDSMSMQMIKAIFPADFVSWLEVLRSPVTTLPCGRQVEMKMISTMGNGFTFPLQTILFASIVSACYRCRSLEMTFNRGELPGNWAVFGDDIIADTRVYRDVYRLLKLLGFTVNAEKSFYEGPFRESCGCDYFSGYNVRGVYLKTLRTPQDHAIALNRLHHWSSVTGIFLKKTTRYLLARCKRRLLVPYAENDDAGIKVPFSLVENMRVDKDCQSVVYRRFVSKPSLIPLKNCEVLRRHRRIYNPSGLFLSFLSGHIRQCSISVRHDVNRYTTKRSVAPSWDPPRKLLTTGVSWQRWNTAVWLTFKD